MATNELVLRATQGVFMISVAARARRDAPADAARVRGARADQARPLAEADAPLLAARRRAAEAHPGADDELGMNLAGVERVLEMEELMEAMRRSAWRADASARCCARDRRGAPFYKRELVRWQPPGQLARGPSSDRNAGRCKLTSSRSSPRKRSRPRSGSRTSAAIPRSRPSTCSRCCSSRTAASSSRCCEARRRAPTSLRRASTAALDKLPPWPAPRRRSRARSGELVRVFQAAEREARR